MKPVLFLLFLCLCSAVPARAQSAPDSRYHAVTDLAYSRAWDDEGFLGSGAAITGGIGVRLSDRTALRVLVSRTGYFRDVEYLTFDGRILFAGVEAAFHGRQPSARPFFTLGAGLMNDRGTWTQKTLPSPQSPSVITATIARRYDLVALTASGGIDFKISRQVAVAAGVRFFGLLQTGEDLAPHVVIQPGLGVVYRW